MHICTICYIMYIFVYYGDIVEYVWNSINMVYVWIDILGNEILYVLVELVICEVGWIDWNVWEIG